MHVIKQPNLEIIRRIGSNTFEGKSRRLLKYVAVVPIRNGIILYNTMTRSVVVMREDEYENILTGDGIDYIEFLKRNYFIVEEDFDDFNTLETVRKSFEIPLDDNYLKEGELLEYTMLSTTDCNANCFYCYEKGRSRIPMSMETADKVADFIIRTANRQRKIKLRWFGGEPLFNIKVIDHISKKVTEAGIDYDCGIISNGYFFNEKIVEKAVNVWKLKHIQITLDGTEDVYNSIKNYNHCTGSAYKKVLDNIKLLLDAHVSVSIRMNCDLHNSENLKELIKELHDRFKNHQLFNVYVYPLFDEKEERTKEHNELLFQKIEEIENVLDQYGYLDGRPISDNIRFCHCMIDNGKSVLICPEGDIGLCEHFSEDHFFSHIDNFEEKNWEVVKQFKELLEPLEICKTCIHAPDCVRANMCDELRKCNELTKAVRERETVRTALFAFKKWQDNRMKQYKCSCN